MNENIFLILIYLEFLVSVLSVGSIISHISRLEYDNRIEDYFFRFVFGSIFFSYLFQFLGALHLLYEPLLLAFYLIPLVYPFTRLALSKKHFHFNPTGDDALRVIIVGFILFPVIPDLFLLPHSWDSLAYHLLLPKVYLNDHLFRFYSDFPQTGFPIGIESLYAFGELFKEPRFANLLNFTFLTGAFAYIIFGLKKIFSPKVLLLAATIYLLRNPLYTENSTNPLIDYGFSFFGLAGGISLYKFMISKKTGWLMLLFILGLFFPLIKLSGFFILLALIPTTAIFIIKNHPPIKWRKIVIFTFIAALPLIFWLTKNTVLTHDPIYPFMTNVFKSFDYDPKSYISIFDEIQKDYWQLNKILTDYSYFGDVLYFVMLIVSSFASLFMIKGKVRYLSLFAILSLIPIGIMVRPTYRYYLPIVPIAALVSANWFFTVIDKWKWRYLPLIAAYILSLYVQVDTAFSQRQIFFTNVPKKTILSYFNFKNSKSYYYQNDNALMIEYVNKNLDIQKDKILFVFDNRLYYFQIPVVFENSTIFGHFTNPLINTPEEVTYALKNEGITHVLIGTNWGTSPNFKTDLFQAFVAKKLKAVHSTGGLTLYTLL